MKMILGGLAALTIAVTGAGIAHADSPDPTTATPVPGAPPGWTSHAAPPGKSAICDAVICVVCPTSGC
jgi:hypothetical protein